MTLQRMPTLVSEIRKLTIHGRQVDTVAEKRLSAFSASSRLARYDVILRGRPTIHVQLRSNCWPKTAADVARALQRRGLRVPSVLLYRPKSRFVLYEELPGQTLRTLPLTEQALSPLLPKIGKLLAAIHSSPAPKSLHVDSRAGERRHTLRCLRRIRQRAPLFHQPALTLLKGIHDKGYPHQRVLTHGDFQASNILFDRQKHISVIDFTLSRRSSPAADIATFLIHTDAMTRGRLSSVLRQRLRKKFLHAYLAASPLSRRRSVHRDLPVSLTETILDVCATTLESYGAQDPNARSLVTYLLDLDVQTAYV